MRHGTRERYDLESGQASNGLDTMAKIGIKSNIRALRAYLTPLGELLGDFLINLGAFMVFIILSP